MARTESPHTPELCQAAYERLLPTLDALDPASLLATPDDLRAVARVALDAIDVADETVFHARLAKMPPDELDPKVIDLARDAARAMRHMLQARDAAEGAGNDVVLPEPLAVQAHDMRGRMLKVVLHYFEDDAELSAELKGLGRKKGHGPLRNDLLRLASVYERRRDVVERDPKYYRAEDLVDARTMADEIEKRVRAARSEDARGWDDRLARAFTVLAPAYEELRAAGQYLLRHGGAERFAALPGARRRAKAPAAATAATPATE